MLDRAFSPLYPLPVLGLYSSTPAKSPTLVRDGLVAIESGAHRFGVA
jgi:hypothetical protein